VSGTVLRTVCSAALAALVMASPAVAAPVAPDPGPSDVATGKAPGSTKSIAELLTEMRTLYRQAEEATEKYNGTVAELKKRSAEAKRLGSALAAARLALSRSHDEAGRLAREQYQGRSGFSSYAQLLLARDPEHALDQGHVIQRVAADRAATVKRLTDAAKHADGLATASGCWRRGRRSSATPFDRGCGTSRSCWPPSRPQKSPRCPGWSSRPRRRPRAR
jgi:hypothetical protein